MELEKKFWIEPKEGITNNSEMINEIVTWAQSEGKELEIISIDTQYPNIMIDGKKYIAKLEPPKTLLFNSGIAMGKGMLGFKNIYFYEV